MIDRIKKHLIEYNILIILLVLVLVEKAFLLVPVLQYFTILIVLVTAFIAIIKALMFKEEDKSLITTFNKNYNKLLVYSLLAITVILTLSSFYGSFFMKQPKNKELLLILWTLTIVTLVNLVFNLMNKNLNLNNTNTNFLVFITCLLIVFISTIVLFVFPNLQFVRLLINLTVVAAYLFITTYINKARVKNENL